MVVSKRCKVCAVLDAENIPITGEYFGKLLPKLIVKISGIDLDPRKANGVLICQSCAVQLVQTDLIIDKLRNSLQRLKILVKEKIPKTPSKDSTEDHSKKIINELQNTEKSEACEISSQSNIDESKTPNLIKPTTSKKKTTCNSILPDSKLLNIGVFSKDNGQQSFNKSETDNIDCETILNHSKVKDETLKKIARRKSVLPDEKLVKNDDTSKQNGENVATSAKFKKILDNEVTAVKNTLSKATKRKTILSTNESLNNTSNSIQFTELNLEDSTPMKRNKTMSLSANEESPMDLTVDEQDSNETMVKKSKVKSMNCIICGKVFHQKSALRDHIETSHMGERLKACPHCSSEFRSQQKYESHVFSEKCKNTNHPCQYPKCNKRFKSVHKMELHMQEKHSSQIESEAE